MSILQRRALLASNHPRAIARPLLNQEGSFCGLPSSDEEGKRLWRGVVVSRTGKVETPVVACDRVHRHVKPGDTGGEVTTSMTGEIINHLWQSTVFALLAGLLTLAFRKNRAQVRYWLWFAASVKLLLPFSLLLTLGAYLGRSRPVTGSLAVPAISYTVAQVAEPFPVTSLPIPSPHQNLDWIRIALVSLWACGLAGMVLIRLRAWLRIRAVVRASSPLKIPFAVPVRSSPARLEPGVVGIFRPILLLPAGMVERFAPKQLASVLAHELCHVRRRDNLTAAVHMIVEAVFWFHPLVWWISARLMEERECACDEAVLELGSEPQVYAESILKTCEFCVESPLSCVSGVTGADLKKRIVRIMTEGLAHKLTFGRKLLLASFALGAVLGPLVLGLKVAPQVWAQNSQPGGEHRPAFEVASIKPNPGCQNKPPAPGPRTFTPSPDRMEMPCVSLRSLIQTAYGTFRRRRHGSTHSRCTWKAGLRGCSPNFTACPRRPRRLRSTLK